MVPPLQRGSRGSPQRQLCPAAAPAKGAALAPYPSEAPAAPSFLLWLSGDPFRLQHRQLLLIPGVKRVREKACLRKRQLAGTAACSAVFYWPPCSTSTKGVAAPTAPWQRRRVCPLCRDARFPWLLQAAALQPWLTK